MALPAGVDIEAEDAAATETAAGELDTLTAVVTTVLTMGAATFRVAAAAASAWIPDIWLAVTCCIQHGPNSRHDAPDANEVMTAKMLSKLHICVDEQSLHGNKSFNTGIL